MHVPLRRYAPLHGSWEALIRSPVYTNPLAPRAGESGVDTDKGTEARLVGDISNASGNLCKGACVRSSTWKLQGHRAHNLLKRRVRTVN